MKNLLLILLTIPLMFGSCKKNRLRRNTWSKTFGGSSLDIGYHLQQTTDGGYIITGRTTSYGNGGDDVYLLKTDENGEEEWYNTFGGSGIDSGFEVHQTTDGGYIITGITNSFGNGGDDVYLIKTDGSGNEQWSKTFGGTNQDQGNSVQQTSDGGYIISGYTEFGNNYGDVYLIKTDGNGDSLWTKTFGGTVSESGYSVKQTTDGGYIICGTTRSFGNGEEDVYLIKTDGSGNEQWSKTFGGYYEDQGYEVQQTTDGGYIITGDKQSSTSESDFYLIKTNLYGNEQWSKTYDGSTNDYGNSVHQTTDGGYIILGLLFTNPNDIYLIKTDDNGIEEWNKTIGGTEFESPFTVRQTLDGGYIVGGNTNSFGNGSYDVYLIKTDKNGDFI